MFEYRVIIQDPITKRDRDIGSVTEVNEELARCAAISKFGISDDEAEVSATRYPGIYTETEFSVMKS